MYAGPRTIALAPVLPLVDYTAILNLISKILDLIKPGGTAIPGSAVEAAGR